MTVEEIFSQVSHRLIEGFMLHEQFADYFDFVGLKGYSMCQEHHYNEESKSYRRISRYFIEHYDKLMLQMPVSNPNIIPEAWRSHVRQDVDTATRKKAIMDGLEKWIAWETGSKNFYSTMYGELLKIGEVAGAKQVMKLVKDVDYELAEAIELQIRRKADDYDISNVIMEQEELQKKYKK